MQFNGLFPRRAAVGRRHLSDKPDTFAVGAFVCLDPEPPSAKAILP
jgi:hypothetical protein